MRTLFAKVVLGLPVKGPFDYLIPQDWCYKIKPGVRCTVPFRDKKMIGYVVGISETTSISPVKPIYDVIDDMPILSEELLKLTKKVSEYYLCSWGEAIETALPPGLRTARTVTITALPSTKNRNSIKSNPHITLIHDLKGDGRWQVYLKRIRENLDLRKKVIFLSPQIQSAIKIQEKLKRSFNQEIALLHSQQTNKESLLEWQKIVNGQVNLIVGTRLAVFSPAPNLGLIIVDNENDQSYKQDQVPHYHAREVALMRASLNRADLILGSSSPSLEAMYLVKKKNLEYVLAEGRNLPQINIIDRKQEGFYKKKGAIFSYSLENIITKSLECKEKILFFLNRKGFATYAMCPNCGVCFLCPRCNVNLTYHFKENNLRCHYCNYKTEAAQLCPNCHSSYIRYSGAGTEKIESELSRLYPKAKIAIMSENKIIPEGTDILISSSAVFRQARHDFDLILVSSIDNYLNRNDFRAAEKTFSLLMQLVALTPKRMFIQTALSRHYCIEAIKNLDFNLFYESELGFRKQLCFPPFSHLALVKLRGKNQEAVREKAEALFDKLSNPNTKKSVDAVSCFSPEPAKLRGNFYWHILLKSRNAKSLSDFLKRNLKDFRSSGIIVTVDVDPL